MTPSTFATKSLPPLDQLQAWQEWFSPVFDIYRTGDIGAEFHARNRVWSAGDILISRVSAPSVRVTRTKDNIAKAPIDHWVLTYCREGATAVRTPRGEFNAAGGVPFLWSIGEEFESERTRVDRIQILLSRDSFSDLAPLLDASRGSAIETPWGSLLGDYMTAVERWLPSMEASDMPRLAQTLRNMIAACIAPSAEHSILARRRLRVACSSASGGLFRPICSRRNCNQPCFARFSGSPGPSFTACSNVREASSGIFSGNDCCVFMRCYPIRRTNVQSSPSQEISVSKTHRASVVLSERNSDSMPAMSGQRQWPVSR